jgi:hypothetical protein
MDVLTHDTAPVEKLPRGFGFRHVKFDDLLANEGVRRLQQSGPGETENSLGAVSFTKIKRGSALNPNLCCKNGETRANTRMLAYGTLAVVGP